MNIEDKVLNILEEVCYTNEVKLDKNINLFDTQLLDSLTTVELLLSIEEQIGIQISPSDVLKVDIETPKKIVELVNKKFIENSMETYKYDEIFLPVRDKNQSILIQKKFLQNKNILSIYGSSEFTGEKDEFFPTRFFNENKEKCNFMVSLAGTGYYQSIIHALNFGALGDNLRNKKIVFIVSFQWFTKEGLRPSQFSMVVSELMFYSFMFNSDIDRSLKDYVVERVKYLSSEDKKLTNINKFCVNYLSNNLNGEILDKYIMIYKSLLEKDNETYKKYENVLKYIECYKNTNNKLQYNWDEEISKAQKKGENKSTNNKFAIEDEYFNKYIKDVLEESNNKFLNYSYSSSPEYKDFEFLLKVCKVVGVEPLFAMIPVNGKWYDYSGFNVNDRIKHYNKIIDIIKLYGFSYKDFTEHEYEEHFLRDIMHLGWKGWVYFNQSIYNFKTNNK